MLTSEQTQEIKDITREILERMTIKTLSIELRLDSLENDDKLTDAEYKDVVMLNITIEEPQILIGQNGQALFELERVLKMIFSKKLNKIFYLNLDINDYKKKRIEYLKSMARDLADQVSITKEKKSLFPMPAYERRVIHMELAKRQDIITQSEGEGQNRYIVIAPR